MCSVNDVFSRFFDDVSDAALLEGKPFVYEYNGALSLHFDIGSIQSQMVQDDPTRLVLGYTRSLMGFLLFQPAPERIAMIGLGGGSIAKYCHRYLPDTRLDVVEISPEVIALRDRFQIPPDDARFAVIQGDGADYVATHRDALDVLIVDGFDINGQAAQLGTQAFYDDCHASLRDEGVMAVNLSGIDTLLEVYLSRIRRSFGQNILITQAKDCTNQIVFACKGRAADCSNSQLIARARMLDVRHPIRFSNLAARLIQDRRTGKAAG